jgi:hypothetical protein
MERVRASLLILALGLGLVLLGAQATWAYQLAYIGSGFSSQSGVPNVSDGGDSTSDGPYSKWDASYVSTNSSASLGSVNASSSGYGQWYNDSGLNSITVEVGTSAWGSSSTGSGSAYSSVATNETGTTTGIFFQIIGEPSDQPVRVNYTWYASINNGVGGTAVLGGGSGTPMYISVNEYPAGTPSDPIWQKDAISVGSGSAPEYSESGYFMAKVGDIIGINLAADANIDFSGSVSSYSMVYNSMQLDAVPLPPSVWLLGSGLFGLLALSGFRPRRR